VHETGRIGLEPETNGLCAYPPLFDLDRVNLVHPPRDPCGPPIPGLTWPHLASPRPNLATARTSSRGPSSTCPCSQKASPQDFEISVYSPVESSGKHPAKVATWIPARVGENMPKMYLSDTPSISVKSFRTQRRFMYGNVSRTA